MVMNVLNIRGEIIVIVVSALVLIFFSLTFSPFVTRLRIPSRRMEELPQSGDNPENQIEMDKAQEDKIRAEDYVESFNGNVVQGRGIVPLMVSVISIGLLIWWVVYLVTNWSQYLWSVRTFWR